MTTDTSKSSWTSTFGPGTRICFDQISEPGCYICNWSGHLLRVPPDGIALGRSPLLNMVGSRPLYVTKVCDNPFVTVTKVRMLAADFDLAVNF